MEIYDNPSGRKGKGAVGEGVTTDQVPAPKLIECYIFTVSYGEDGATFDLAKRAGHQQGAVTDTSTPTKPTTAIKQSSANIIHVLVELTGSLAELPSSRTISKKVC